MIPTATVLTSTGKKTSERSRPRTRMLEVRSTASSMPSTTLRPLVTTAYTTVCRRPLRSACSEKN